MKRPPVKRRRRLKESGPTAANFDWKRFDALTDADIERAIRSDPDAAPLLDSEWFRNAILVIPKHSPK